jgi:hypothetical protein
MCGEEASMMLVMLLFMLFIVIVESMPVMP